MGDFWAPNHDFGTGSGGIIVADPTEPGTQVTSAATDASAEYDINNIAGSGNSIEMSIAVSFRISLSATLLIALCTAAALW